MTPTAANLRLTTAPTRVSELLLPTVISLLTRAPASAETFSTLLQPEPPSRACPPPGTRVTASHDGHPPILQSALPTEQVNS